MNGFWRFLKNLFGGNFKITSDGSYRDGEKSTIFPDGMSDTTDFVNGLVTPSDGRSSIFGALTNLLNAWSGEHMTNAEVERNQMQMQNQEDIYQRQVSGMQAAGLNPALMYQSGASSAPSAPSAQAPGLNMSDVIQALYAKKQFELSKYDARSRRIEAEASMQNAISNARNAGTGEFNAETNRMRQEVEAWVAKSNIQVNDATIAKLTADTVQINMFTQQLPERLEIMKQEADSKSKQAAASLQSALAQVRQVVLAEKMSTYEASLLEAQAYVTWANGDGQSIVNQYLDESQRLALEKTAEEIRRTSAQRKFYDAQSVRAYVNCATDVSDAVNRWINPFAKAKAVTPDPTPMDLSGAYQTSAYGYD